MNSAKTPTQRKADERLRHKQAGRVAVTVHVLKAYVPDVRAFEAALRKREAKLAGLKRVA